jgi:hypothetical protein
VRFCCKKRLAVSAASGNKLNCSFQKPNLANPVIATRFVKVETKRKEIEFSGEILG